MVNVNAGLIAFMTSGPVVALSLRRCDAITAWRTLAGPTDAIIAKRDQPNWYTQSHSRSLVVMMNES